MSDDELRMLRDNWYEEKEAAYIFRAVAEREKDSRKKEIFKKLASIEEEHAAVWERELQRNKLPLTYTPRLRTHVYLFLIRCCGRGSLFDLLERLKRSKIRIYFDQLGNFESDVLKKNVKTLFAIEKSHRKVLDFLSERSSLSSGSWHKSGVRIRDIIFGMNDGLLSTFSLIAGMTGGAVTNTVVLFAGIAGAIAGAVSMAAGAFVATRAEREVMQQQLAIEQRELELMPEAEEQELTSLYKRKGLSGDRADTVAKTILSNKDVALETMAREELGFSTDEMAKPLQAAFFSGGSFIVGAAVPIIPFLVCGSEWAFWVALVISLSGFFVIGSVRTIVTGKNALRSGFEMFVIGTGAAILTYCVGKWIGVRL